ncbi:MAG: iron-containing alcohol dehydrogenase [Clostridiales bacterium]|nr:iron-containing alcohol dehydrogenase [Clostridiales bacterium]
MNQFTYCVPTNVIFGAGTVSQVGQAVAQCGGTHVLVLYGGGSVLRNGTLDKVTASLEAAKLRYDMEGGVQPNPRLALAQKLTDKYQTSGIDFLLAVGGGSVLATAKAMAMGLYGGSPIWDYFDRTRPVTGELPVGSVLTIAAAGSETSDSAVLTNEEIHVKRGCSTPHNRPRFAIMDPELTYTLSPYQTACGVTDIMMHTLERYFAKDAGQNQMTDGIAEALLRNVMENGLVAMTEPENYQARSEIMWCGSLSHNDLTGLGRDKDFAVHQLGHQLSAVYDLAHGASLSAMWPHWAKYVCHNDMARFANLGRKVLGLRSDDDETCVLATIRSFMDYWHTLGMPVCLGDCIGVQNEATLKSLARGCSYQGTRTIGAFVKLDQDDMLEIYRMANI